VSVYARVMLCFSRRVVHSGKLPEIYVRKEKTLKANFLSGAKTAPELREIGAGLFAYVQHGSWGYSNAGLITSGGASLLVDTLYDLALTRSMLKEEGSSAEAGEKRARAKENICLIPHRPDTVRGTRVPGIQQCGRVTTFLAPSPRWEPYALTRSYGSGAAKLAAIPVGESPTDRRSRDCRSDIQQRERRLTR